MWNIRLYRWRKRLLLPLAAMPLFQTVGTCDPGAVAGSAALGVGSSVFNLFIGSLQAVLLQTFPSADILQALLGGNSSPFFTG